MRLSLQLFRGRLPESVLQPRSVLSGSLTEYLRGQTLSSQGVGAPQLYTDTGLAPQQPGLQGVGAPQLAVTPAPAPTAAPATTVTPETTFSMSALLGSTGRPLFSPLPATTLFQDSPSAVQSVALPVVPQTLPSGGRRGVSSSTVDTAGSFSSYYFRC